MESIRLIFKIGNGPSSSHTMGPKKAAEEFILRNPDASSFKVYLYGSLALTGKGHLTDVVLKDTLPAPAEIIFCNDNVLEKHPNGLMLEAYNEKKELSDSWTVYSTGGGEISSLDNSEKVEKIYPLSKMTDIMQYTQEEGMTIWEYIRMIEDNDFEDYLNTVWLSMKEAISRGLQANGTLPGSLKVRRKARSYHIRAKMQNEFAKDQMSLFAYALAVSEENASGGVVVTAPTCGSSGILPSVLYWANKKFNLSDKEILRGIAAAGLIGNLIKTNASISGAEVGCQGEVGSACAMASGALTQLLGGSTYQIEYAASMGIEHHLGLTCDPIAGLVQIPCIERNAFGAKRAVDSALYSINSDGQHMVSFDNVVDAMKQTGHDLPSLYKETSQGGLAVLGIPKKK